MKPSQNSPKTPAVEIDDREPMDRLADELGRFVQAMQKMNARQMAQPKRSWPPCAGRPSAPSAARRRRCR
jgi:hypothetical protein